MTYFFIALVILAIVAPIIQVLPSREQKLAMAKRREAMSQGIGVELVKIEDPDPDPKKYQTSTARPLPRELSTTAYRIHRRRRSSPELGPAFELVRYAGEKRIPFVENWHWASIDQELKANPLKEHLASTITALPPDVVRIEEKNNFLSLYWREAGEVSEVIDFLKRTVEIQP